MVDWSTYKPTRTSFIYRLNTDKVQTQVHQQNIPLAYLNFNKSLISTQELLHQSEQEFGYNHPMGGITIPCSEDVFPDLASRFGAFSLV
ncbi:putative small auxin-up RNA [Helianthus debilis subsp. tardiflorus]